MKIVLLGDSIRLLGYGKEVEHIFSGTHEVWQSQDNDRYARYTLRMLCDNRAMIDACDIVHWNNGLHDVARIVDDGEPFTPLDEYFATVKRIAEILLAKGKKVIFATTTPVRNEHENVRNEDIVRYNAAVVPMLRELGVSINDLYGFVLPETERFIKKEDNIHLTDEGIRAVGREVCETIRHVADM